MTEVNLKSIKVKLDGSKVEAGYGDMMLKTNIETVKNAIVSAAGAIGLENCLKLGGGAAVATSLYVAAKSISRYFPWAKVRGVKENNILEVSVPDKHRDRFHKSTTNGTLTKILQKDFGDLDNTLAAILEVDEYEKVGSEVLELIKNVQVEAVSSEKDTKQEAVGTEIGGELQLTEKNRNAFVVPKDGQSAYGKIIKKGAKATINQEGGNEFIGSGLDGKTIATIAEQREQIKLTIRGPDLSGKKFEGKFEPTDTIEDVIEALKEKEGKTFRIFRDDKQLDKGTTISQITTLRAEIESGAGPMVKRKKN